MSGKAVAFFLAVSLVAAIVGWQLAFTGPSHLNAEAPKATAPKPIEPSPKMTGAPNPTAWVPPTGEPVERFRAAKTTEERLKVIADFITLGHDQNAAMLREAVNDSDAKVRMNAIESAASMLTPEAAREVYRVSGISPDPDIRSMTWSFLAPHPMENRVAVYGEVLQKGPDVAVEEAIAEMGRTPEMPLFETMLFQSSTKDMPPTRAARLLKEMNEWLKPGGGDVPEFRTVTDLQAWWQANRRRYDQYMLRVDL